MWRAGCSLPCGAGALGLGCIPHRVGPDLSLWSCWPCIPHPCSPQLCFPTHDLCMSCITSGFAVHGLSGPAFPLPRLINTGTAVSPQLVGLTLCSSSPLYRRHKTAPQSPRRALEEQTLPCHEAGSPRWAPRAPRGAGRAQGWAQSLALVWWGMSPAGARADGVHCLSHSLCLPDAAALPERGEVYRGLHHGEPLLHLLLPGWLHWEEVPHR